MLKMMITQYRSTSSPPPPSKTLTISTLELASRLTLMLASILTWRGRGEEPCGPYNPEAQELHQKYQL